MANITKGVAREYGHLAGLIDKSVLARLDQVELIDRLNEVIKLTSKANKATDPVTKRGYRQVAQAMLSAPPRAEVEGHIQGLLRKASVTPDFATAEALRKEAARYKTANPVPPRSRIAKAVEDQGQTPLYDQSGKLIGVCDPSKIVPALGVYDPNGKLVGTCDPDSLDPLPESTNPQPAAEDVSKRSVVRAQLTRPGFNQTIYRR